MMRMKTKMKIALVTDIHFGARNDNQKIADFQERFFRDVFFPYLKDNNINTIVDLGDTFDRRKFINFVSLDRAKKMFFDPIDQNNYDFHVLVGNHDSFYKNTLEINSMDLLASHYPTMNIYNKPEVATFDGTEVVMLPWICADNQDQVDAIIAETKSQVLFGHLELSGYQMYKGQSINHGMKDDWLGKFDLVCTGHYHTRSTKGNVNYLGCPYEMTWSDYDDPKGFHIFDTETRDITFIENPFKLFKKVFYNDSESSVADIVEQDMDQYRNSFVKVIINNKTNPYWFDMFMERLEKVEPIHVQVVEDHLNLDLEDADQLIEEAQDTLSILTNYVDQLEQIVDKSSVSKVVHELYQEALRID